MGWTAEWGEVVNYIVVNGVNWWMGWTHQKCSVPLVRRSRDQQSNRPQEERRRRPPSRNCSSQFCRFLLQTHREFQAVNFLQRNRNWANGILFIPTSWARNSHTILEVIKLVDIKTSTIYFDNGYSFGTNIEQSMMIANNIKDFTGPPIETCIEAVEHLIS